MTIEQKRQSSGVPVSQKAVTQSKIMDVKTSKKISAQEIDALAKPKTAESSLSQPKQGKTVEYKIIYEPSIKDRLLVQ